MRKLPLPLLIFLGFFSLYLYTLAPSVPAQGDAGELITVAYTLGIAHPPGYPLYTLLGHLFSLLPFGSVAWRVNLMSAVFHSLALVFVYLTVEKLTKSRLAAFGSAAVLGFSYTFWLYSLVAEVFSLNDFFAALLIYLAVTNRLYLFSFILGLALTNHLTIVLILPAIAYYLWPLRKRILNFKFLILNLILLLLAMLPYSYLYIRAKTAVMPVTWGYPDTIAKIVRIVTRADYGTFNSVKGKDPALATLAEKQNQIKKLINYEIDDFTLVGLVLALLGVVLAWRKWRRAAIFTATGYFISGLFFLSYANFPVNDLSGVVLQIVERFYLLPNVFLALALGFFIAAAAGYVARVPVLRLLAWPLVIFFAAFLFTHNFFEVSQRGNFLAVNLAKNALTSALPDSIMIAQGDVGIFTMVYARYAENFRSDVEVISSPNFHYDGLKYLKSVRPELNITGEAAIFPWKLIEENFGKVKFQTLGAFLPFVNSPDFITSPSGMLFNIYRRDDLLSWEEWERGATAAMSLYKYPTAGEMKNYQSLADFSVLWHYQYMYANMAYLCSAQQNYICAVNFYQQALSYGPSRSNLRLGLAEALSRKGECEQSQREYEEILADNPGNTDIYLGLEINADKCFMDKSKTEYFRQKISDLKSQKETLKGL